MLRNTKKHPFYQATLSTVIQMTIKFVLACDRLQISLLTNFSKLIFVPLEIIRKPTVGDDTSGNI